jgi:hypothetical protein
VRLPISTPVSSWAVWCRVTALGLVLVLGCSGEDRVSPSSEVPVATDNPADSTGAVDSTTSPADSTVTIDSTVPIDSSVTVDSAGILAMSSLIPPGIVFGSIQLPTSLLTSLQNGTLMGGQISPTSALSILTATRAKGGRIVIKMCKGADSYVKNADGTFSFTKWKALVDRFRSVNLGPFISDGTILGHYLIDEPHRASRWGGKVISQATLEEMAKYSKQIWPNLTTFVRVAPSWLATSSITYSYLDAGWLQYESWMGSISTKISTEVTAAKRKGLGLAVGLNLINGGNGSSHIAGTRSGQYSMSATEIRSYGAALLGQSLSCGLYNWVYDSPYYSRTDIKSAMADLSSKARAHVRTSCRQ